MKNNFTKNICHRSVGCFFTTLDAIIFLIENESIFLLGRRNGISVAV